MNRYPERIYLRRVARHLTCPRRERNRLLEQARLEIGAFCAQEGPADLRRLQQAFGQPTVFADTLMSEFSCLQRLRFVRRKRRQLAAALVLLLLSGLILKETVFIYHDNSGYDVVTEAQIVE